ncbi:TetR/AcrR family transcriptional regulator [Hyphomicrobium sulfonivorans]|uniref:TetR/AcrR family transcriptional regulator n=1 Tax=Hyphomicrobium sulfonivorans TaxID=121290 RepID=UPI00156E091C|nr:TetR family transcriptional regulator [Hyphomicrobium sulfonivorans]MBI1651371.1 TetR/AcrR family transcriptional regulator [Hyphomicrobium sulfonivorans]
MDHQEPSRKQLILDAALDIIEHEGMKALTQPRIAKACGLRQSHLTYYFPRKADLYIALLEASHMRAEAKAARKVPLEGLLVALFFDPERMRFFLSIILEVGDDPDLQPILQEHGKGLCVAIARHLGRPDNDPDVESFVNEMRGVGVTNLMSVKPVKNGAAVMRKVAARHGLKFGGK